MPADAPRTTDPYARRFHARHRFVIPLIGLWSIGVFSLAAVKGYGWEHGVTEALVPLGFGIAATWAWPDAWQRIGLATVGLCAAHLITVHLAEGHWAAHGVFFLLAAILLVYQVQVTNLLLGVEVLVLHVGVAMIDPHSVYGHGWSGSARALLVGGELMWVAVLALGLALRRRAKEPSGPGPQGAGP